MLHNTAGCSVSRFVEPWEGCGIWVWGRKELVYMLWWKNEVLCLRQGVMSPIRHCQAAGIALLAWFNSQTLTVPDNRLWLFQERYHPFLAIYRIMSRTIDEALYKHFLRIQDGALTLLSMASLSFPEQQAQAQRVGPGLVALQWQGSLEDSSRFWSIAS